MNIQSSKKQEYKYSIKTGAYADTSHLGMMLDKFLFYLVPPQDSIAIKSLRTSLKIQFDASIPVADQIIEQIGITSDYLYDENEAAYFRSLMLNKAADANRIVELDIDLTSLLKKDNVFYNAGMFNFGNSSQFTFIWLKIGRGTNLQSSFNGLILKWKADALFVTKGIK